MGWRHETSPHWQKGIILTDSPFDPHPLVCSAKRRDGKPCAALAVFSGTTCYMHSGLAAAAQRAGGRSHAKRLVQIEVPSLDTATAQREFIETAIRMVIAGDLPLSIAKFIVYGVATIKTIGDDELNDRITALEQSIVNR